MVSDVCYYCLAACFAQLGARTSTKEEADVLPSSLPCLPSYVTYGPAPSLLFGQVT